MIFNFITEALGLSKDELKAYLEELGFNVSDPMASKIWFWIITVGLLAGIGTLILRGCKSIRKWYNEKYVWRRNYIEDKLGNDYGDYLKKENYRLFIPTRFQNVPPNDYPDPHDSLVVSSNLLIEKYLTEIMTKENTNHDLYCVLGGSGMGKTTFAIHLFKEYINRYSLKSCPFDISMLSLSDDSVIERIGKIEKPNQHILILDALDESSQAARNFGGFKGKLENAVRDFRVVIITCRTQFFRTEDDELKESKLHNLGISKGFRKYNRQYLSPLNDKDIEDYLKRKYRICLFSPSTYKNYGKLDKAKSLIHGSGNVMVRPLMLTYIDDLLDDDKENRTTNDLYHHLIGKWIDREARMVPGDDEKNRIREAIWKLSQQLAVNIYQYRKKRGGFFITHDEFETFKEMNGYADIEYSFDSRSLVNRNSVGEIKFAHKSFLEFFLAKEKWENPKFRIDFEGMDMAALFVKEQLQMEIGNEVKKKNITVQYQRESEHVLRVPSDIESICFLKPCGLRYEYLSLFYSLRHVSLHGSVIDERMMSWIYSLPIRSITIQKARIDDWDILYSIKTLEVIHFVDCDVHINPSTLRELRLRGLTLIQDDVTRCFVPRKSMYADRKINKFLANSRRAVDFGAMVEIPA